MTPMIIIRDDTKEIEIVGEVYLEDFMEFMTEYFLTRDDMSEYKFTEEIGRISSN